MSAVRRVWYTTVFNKSDTKAKKDLISRIAPLFAEEGAGASTHHVVVHPNTNVLGHGLAPVGIAGTSNKHSK